MKRRMTNGYKILAVAAAVATGCSPASGPARGPEHDSGAVAAEAEPAEGAATVPASHPASKEPAAIGVAVGSAQGDDAEARPSLPPGPIDSLPAEQKTLLNTLLGNLLSTDKAAALEKLSHYRPMCDEAGYPLVGNVQRKGMGTNLQPSELCAEVRTRESR